MVNAKIKLLITFSSIIFFSLLSWGCSSLKELPNQKKEGFSPKEQEHLEAFFKRLMIQEGAAYTLLGSKPMTAFQMTGMEPKNWFNTLSIEEKKKVRLFISEVDANSKWFKALPEKTQKGATITHSFQGDFMKGFLLATKRLNIKKFLLFKGRGFRNPDEEAIYFVNIVQTILVIKENYQAFKEVVKSDFSPIEVVFDLVERKYGFWDPVLAHPELLGILFGYGRENAWLWSMQCSKNSASAEDFKKRFFKEKGDKLKDYGVKDITNPEIKNLVLPRFFSFFSKDAILEKYKEERKEIKKRYRGRDFLDVTLQLLESDF